MGLGPVGEEARQAGWLGLARDAAHACDCAGARSTLEASEAEEALRGRLGASQQAATELLVVDAGELQAAPGGSREAATANLARRCGMARAAGSKAGEARCRRGVVNRSGT